MIKQINQNVFILQTYILNNPKQKNLDRAFLQGAEKIIPPPIVLGYEKTA